MDPLKALSLACGVIQVLDLSAKVLSECKELHWGVSLSEYQELEDLTLRLVDVRDQLKLTTVQQSVGTTGTAEDQSLLGVATQCWKTADDLVKKVRSLGVGGSQKKRRAVLNVKLLLGRDELRDIQKCLDAYRDVLDTRILINLRYVFFGCPASGLWHTKLIYSDRYEDRQRLDLASLQDRKDFQKIDQEAVSQVWKESETLNNLILNKNKQTREYISGGFQEHESRRAGREQHTHLLESLWFAEIYVRQKTIYDAHGDTFQGIFDKSDRAVRPWDNFVAWLENGQGIYWISGKPGSGKSTLMSLLCQDDRTKEALEIWSGTKKLLMARFFFWSAGTMMQKNFDGFLRSLLWQILQEFPNIDVLPSRIGSNLEQNGRRVSYSQVIGVWTNRRLRETLHGVINKLQTSCCLCFFIDGLDEFDDDEDALIEFLQSIVSNNIVKVCLSSRPERKFEDAFGSSARLRLQDLTRNDIRRYVDARFQNEGAMTFENDYEVNKLLEGIVDKAEGVFLWVFLAVKDQTCGLRDGDHLEELQKRLDRFPNEIEGLYTHMLHRIDKVDARQASMFLQMTLYEPNMSVLELALASYPDLEDILSSADEISKQQMVSLCQSTRKRLMTGCVGLLEVHEDPDQEDIEEQIINEGSPIYGAKKLESRSEADM